MFNGTKIRRKNSWKNEKIEYLRKRLQWGKSGRVKGGCVWLVCLETLKWLETLEYLVILVDLAILVHLPILEMLVN